MREYEDTAAEILSYVEPVNAVRELEEPRRASNLLFF